jgi:hypothetical protein
VSRHPGDSLGLLDGGRAIDGVGLGRSSEVLTDWEQDELISSWTLVEGDGDLVGEYSWRSRTIERHRAQIRKRFGTRPATEDDEERPAQ